MRKQQFRTAKVPNWPADTGSVLERLHQLNLEYWGLQDVEVLLGRGLCALLRCEGEYYLYNFQDGPLKRIEGSQNLSQILSSRIADVRTVMMPSAVSARPITSSWKYQHTARKSTMVLRIARGRNDQRECQMRNHPTEISLSHQLSLPEVRVVLTGLKEWAIVFTYNHSIILRMESKDQLDYFDGETNEEQLSRSIDRLQNVAKQSTGDLYSTICQSRVLGAPIDKTRPRKVLDKILHPPSSRLQDWLGQIIIPSGWSGNPNKLRRAETAFHAAAYGLRRTRFILAHEDGENYLLAYEQARYYTWNSAGQYLDLIEYPTTFLAILQTLNQPSLLIATQVNKVLEAGLTRELGLPTRTFVPRRWFDSHPFIQRCMKDFPSALYGLVDPLPILINQALSILIVWAKKRLYLWAILCKTRLYRIMDPNDIGTVLRMLDVQEKLRDDTGKRAWGPPSRPLGVRESYFEPLYLCEEAPVDPHPDGGHIFRTTSRT